MCVKPKKNVTEMAGSFFAGGTDGTDGVIVLHAPSKIEDLAKYDQHACGLEHAMQLAQKRLAPQPPAREILPTPTLEPFPQDKTDKWDDMHANFFDKEAPKA